MSNPCTPPRTRSSSKLELDQLNDKFEEIKLSIISELKFEIAAEIQKLITSQQQLIGTLHSKVVEHESTIAVLQANVTALKTENSNLKVNFHNMGAEINQMEQYQRRQTLRIDGIEFQGKEDPETLVKAVHKMMVGVGSDAPIPMVDRAHRIGPVYERASDKKKCKAIMVKFCSFRYRTELYRKRKQLDKNVRVRIDLTKANYKVYKEACNFIYEKKCQNVYVFIDINCRIKIVDSARDEESFVSCIEDAKLFLAN